MRKLVGILLISFVLFSGCATRITKRIQRPAEYDLPGAKSIAVLPFQSERPSEVHFWLFGFYEKESESNRTARLISNEISMRLADDGYFTLVGSDKVQSAIKNSAEIPCDIYLTGYIDRFDSHVNRERKSTEDSEGNVITWHEYVKEVQCYIYYELIDAVSNEVLFMGNEKLSAKSSVQKHEKDLPSGNEILRSEIEDFAYDIVKKMQPYYETVTYVLMTDKTKDPEMKTANELAKEGLLEESAEAFKKIYKAKGYMEAGYNAAVVYQSIQNYEEAEALLQDVIEKFDEPKAMKQLNSVKSDMKKSEKLSNQLESRK